MVVVSVVVGSWWGRCGGHGLTGTRGDSRSWDDNDGGDLGLGACNVGVAHAVFG